MTWEAASAKINAEGNLLKYWKLLPRKAAPFRSRLQPRRDGTILKNAIQNIYWSEGKICTGL
jgi:hypothetical protein